MFIKRWLKKMFWVEEGGAVRNILGVRSDSKSLLIVRIVFPILIFPLYGLREVFDTGDRYVGIYKLRIGFGLRIRRKSGFPPEVRKEMKRFIPRIYLGWSPIKKWCNVLTYEMQEDGLSEPIPYRTWSVL